MAGSRASSRPSPSEPGRTTGRSNPHVYPRPRHKETRAHAAGRAGPPKFACNPALLLVRGMPVPARCEHATYDQGDSEDQGAHHDSDYPGRQEHGQDHANRQEDGPDPSHSRLIGCGEDFSTARSAGPGTGDQVSASSPAGGIYKRPELGIRLWVVCRSRPVVCWQRVTERAERPARPAAWQPIGRKSQIAANARPPAPLRARPGPRVTGAFGCRPSVRPGNMRDRRWMRPADGARSSISALSHCPMATAPTSTSMPRLVQVSRTSWRRGADAVSGHDELHRTGLSPLRSPCARR